MWQQSATLRQFLVSSLGGADYELMSSYSKSPLCSAFYNTDCISFTEIT